MQNMSLSYVQNPSQRAYSHVHYTRHANEILQSKTMTGLLIRTARRDQHLRNSRPSVTEWGRGYNYTMHRNTIAELWALTHLQSCMQNLLTIPQYRATTSQNVLHKRSRKVTRRTMQTYSNTANFNTRDTVRHGDNTVLQHCNLLYSYSVQKTFAHVTDLYTGLRYSSIIHSIKLLVTFNHICNSSFKHFQASSTIPHSLQFTGAQNIKLHPVKYELNNALTKLSNVVKNY